MAAEAQALIHSQLCQRWDIKEGISKDVERVV